MSPGVISGDLQWSAVTCKYKSAGQFLQRVHGSAWARKHRATCSHLWLPMVAYRTKHIGSPQVTQVIKDHIYLRSSTFRDMVSLPTNLICLDVENIKPVWYSPWPVRLSHGHPSTNRPYIPANLTTSPENAYSALNRLVCKLCITSIFWVASLWAFVWFLLTV